MFTYINITKICQLLNIKTKKLEQQFQKTNKIITELKKENVELKNEIVELVAITNNIKNDYIKIIDMNNNLQKENDELNVNIDLQR